MIPICNGKGDVYQSSYKNLFRDTLKDKPRNYVLPAIWASLSPLKLIHKINHHTSYISFVLLLQSRKIQLLTPGQYGERQMLSQCQPVEVGTHRPQPTASSMDLDLQRKPQHKHWDNALLTERRYLVRSAFLNQSFLTSSSLLIANNKAMGRQVPLLCHKVRPLYLVVRVGKIYWWGWPVSYNTHVSNIRKFTVYLEKWKDFS